MFRLAVLSTVFISSLSLAGTPDPILEAMNPNSAPFGGSGAFITLNGSDLYTSGSPIVKWSGQANLSISDTSGSGPNTTIFANTTAAHLATPGTYQVSVLREDGKESNSLPFNVTNVMPSVSNMDTTTTAAGGAGFRINFVGTGINQFSVVTWTGKANLPVQGIAPGPSGMVFYVDVPADYISFPGVFDVAVFNLGPGGGTSTPRQFTATASGAAPSFTVEPNPTKAGMPTVFTLVGNPTTFQFDFGDGATSTANLTTHTFIATQDSTFNVTLTTSGGTTTVAVGVVAPIAPGETGVNTGGDSTNPLDGLKTTVSSSDGGVYEINLDTSGLLRSIDDTSTEWDDIPGRGSTSFGNKAVHKFTEAGVFVAKSTVKAGDGSTRARARKTLAVSAREVGKSEAFAKPLNSSLLNPKLKGKFIYNKDKPDQVTLSSEITLPPGIDPKRPDGQSLSFAMGNVVDNTTVDVRGRGAPSQNQRIKKLSLKLPRLKKGILVTQGGEKAKLQVTFQTPDLDTLGFDTEGITPQLREDEAGQKQVERTIQVALVIAGVSYNADVPVVYALSKNADSGALQTRASR